MSENKLLDLDAVLAADRLTEVLQRAGRLGPEGHVVRAERAGEQPTIISTLVRVRLEYDVEAAGAPASLLLKLPRAGVAPAVAEGARAEAVFYRDVAPLSPPGLLPCCFDASVATDNAACYVLLEDLGSTHAAPTGWPVPPAIAVCEQLVDAYARFHAAWWDDARLGRSVGRFLDDAMAKSFVTEAQRRWPMFRAMLGDRLSAERVERYERFLRSMPRLLEWVRARTRHLTIVHGDAHVWNALYPTVPGATVRIIDWAGWRIRFGVRDLAYMIGLHWYPERRRRFEIPLLRRYHEGLLAHGVSGYAWDALLDDYRWAALWQITIPMWQATVDLPAPVWWSHLERAMLTFEDLGCAALLD